MAGTSYHQSCHSCIHEHRRRLRSFRPVKRSAETRKPRSGHPRITAPSHAWRPRTAHEIRDHEGAPSVIYRPGEGCWWVWWPCRVCGGARLPLRERTGGDASVRARLALTDAIGEQPCPGCVARRRRLEPAGADPTVWYDTWLTDWVVRLPCRGLRDGTLMPLGIQWFNATWPEVYRAASDLAYADDLLHDVRADQ